MCKNHCWICSLVGDGRMLLPVSPVLLSHSMTPKGSPASSRVAKPCLAFLSFLALPVLTMQPEVKQEPKLVTSKPCHASHTEEPPSFSCLERAPFPPHQQEWGESVPRQQTTPFIPGSLQNFPAGNKPQQDIAFAMWGLSR